MRSRAVGLLCVLCGALAMASACGAASNSPDQADAGIPGSVGTGGTCGNAIDCMNGNVCNPTNRQCTPNLKCTSHTDCGNAAYCNAGTCAVNKLYGDCDKDDNCSAGQ